jgi:hypothetical protein
MSLTQIYEGWKNKLLPEEKLKEQIDQVSEERMSICNECKFHSKHHKTIRPDAHCTHCGCTLSAKTKCLSCACPTEKWKPVMTREQEEEIDEAE